MDVLLRGPAAKPRRLIIFLVIIAMCLNMADAAPHRTRHQHNRTCHNRIAKVSLKEVGARLHTINKKLSSTFEKFVRTQSRRGDRKVERGRAAWLPRVSFEDIIRHNHGNSSERFEVLVPRLYKNLNRFVVIFDCLHRVNVSVVDSSDTEDERRRNIEQHQHHLRDLITAVTDTFAHFNRCRPTDVIDRCPKENVSDSLKNFQMHVSQSESYTQDALAFRAYFRALTNWKKAFRCSLPRRIRNPNKRAQNDVFCRKWKQQILGRKRAS